MIKARFALLLPLLLCACFHRQEPKLCSEYAGTLPAASSVGIDTALTFLPDGRFEEKDTYIGEKNGTFYAKGTYTLKDGRITLLSDRGEKTFYRLEHKQIRRLDMNGDQIRGNLADFYTLQCRKS